MHDQQRIAALAAKWLNGAASADEEQELFAWWRIHPEETIDLPEGFASSENQFRNRVLQNMREVIANENKRRFDISIRKWLPYAAAIILLLASVVYYYSNTVARYSTKTTVLAHDILPEKNTAILTLSDGSVIKIDSTGNGAIAKQAGVSISKSGARIVYSPNRLNNNQHEIVYNTMSTQRGGTYELWLPDGTKAWLNAASSITYPVVFSGATREVKISGEVYFEVAKNREKPFTVKVNNDYHVHVLGTNFNVNAYTNEPGIYTTLIDGSVKVVSGSAGQAVLNPGQQAHTDISQQKLSIDKNVDIHEVIAWQRGMFVFDNMNLAVLARQLSRWYDINVETRGNVEDIKLGGGIAKTVPLSATLKVLAASGAKYKWENDKLIFYAP